MNFWNPIHILSVLIICCFPHFVLTGDLEVSDDQDVYNEKSNAIDWAYSPVHTSYLAKAEIEIYRLMHQYRIIVLRRIKMLERYATDYAESTAKSQDPSERAKSIAANPLMALRMVRRFAKNLAHLISEMRSGKESELLLGSIENLGNQFVLPSAIDVANTIDNILRIQSVYDLNAQDIVNGIIAGKRTNVGLTLAQAYAFGEQARKNQMYPQALDWLQHVLKEQIINPSEGVDTQNVINSLGWLIHDHDGLIDTITDENLNEVTADRFQTKIQSNKALKTWKSVSQGLSFRFMNTCNGISVQTEVEKSILHCFLESSTHAFWRINPLKIEIHSWDPFVAQFYDVVGDQMIDHLQNQSLPILSRATVVDHSDNNTSESYTVSGDRTSSYAFLYETHDEIIQKLEKKIGLVTGLVVDNFVEGKYVYMRASESLQTAIYGFGCHFSPHLDALGENESESGDRIGSFMIYLNDVELGGKTAFPYIELAVSPVKHSALFWYDLFKNGKPDERTMHGGCPVIFGHKWVANKWIRHNANFLTRPCSLDRSE